MRGDDQQQSGVFSYISAEQRVPQNHPLRPLRKMVGHVLAGLSPRFTKMYAKRGRPSIAPEKLLRALLLQVLYTIRSERQLMEQLDCNMLYRWFVGLNMDDPIWDVTVFTQESRAVAERRHRAGVLATGTGTGACAESAVGGPLHGGRNVDRSLGGTENFSAQRQTTTAGKWRQQSDGELFTARSGAIKRTNPPQIRKRCCLGSRGAANPS